MPMTRQALSDDTPLQNVERGKQRGGPVPLVVVRHRGAAPIRWTVAGETPAALAIVRQLQCVASSGVVFRVASTSRFTISAGKVGLRPRPASISVRTWRPPAAHRSRHTTTR